MKDKVSHHAPQASAQEVLTSCDSKKLPKSSYQTRVPRERMQMWCTVCCSSIAMQCGCDSCLVSVGTTAFWDTSIYGSVDISVILFAFLFTAEGDTWFGLRDKLPKSTTHLEIGCERKLSLGCNLMLRSGKIILLHPLTGLKAYRHIFGGQQGYCSVYVLKYTLWITHCLSPVSKQSIIV